MKEHNFKDSEWIGVDLDGTIAYYDGWQGMDHIGPPIPLMVSRVKQWLNEGKEVKILTARVSEASAKANNMAVVDIVWIIQNWCEKHIGKRLDVTCEKDIFMHELWDDRAIQVEPNTGMSIAETFMGIQPPFKELIDNSIND